MAAKSRLKSDAPDVSDRVSRIREGVTAAILEHRLLPGTQARRRRDRQDYGASRTLVRTALQQLAHRGRQHRKEPRRLRCAPDAGGCPRGVRSAPADRDHYRDHAVDAVSPAWINRLQQHLAEEREAELRGDARASVRLSGDFHRLIAEMSGHNIYLGFLKELIARSSLIILLYRRHDTPACGTDHHSEIVTAIRKRDKQAACADADHLNEIEAELF